TDSTSTYPLSLHDALPIYVTTDDRDSGLLDDGGHRVDREHLDVAEEGNHAVLDEPAPLGDRGGRVALVIRDRQLDRVAVQAATRSEEHTSELQSPDHLVCR